MDTQIPDAFKGIGSLQDTTYTLYEVTVCLMSPQGLEKEKYFDYSGKKHATGILSAAPMDMVRLIPSWRTGVTFFSSRIWYLKFCEFLLDSTVQIGISNGSTESRTQEFVSVHATHYSESSDVGNFEDLPAESLFRRAQTKFELCWTDGRQFSLDRSNSQR